MGLIRALRRLLPIAVLFLTPVFPSAAQEQPAETIDFAGGALTITENDDFEKIVAFDGRELVRDYAVYFDGIHQVAGTDVAFFYAGPGGNACAPSVVMIWQPEGGEVTAERTEESCETPSPAIADGGVFFVPYLLPGEQAQVTVWGPGEGFSLVGDIVYRPQPGTGWSDLDANAISHPLDLFRNAGLYAAAQAVLGDDLPGFALSLGTAAEPETTADGIVTGRGCVPHACGVMDGFIAVDPEGRALYLAQMQDEGETRFWPDRNAWPAEVAKALPDDF